MNAAPRRELRCIIGSLVLMLSCVFVGAAVAQTQPNVFKEIADKQSIQWKNAPDNAVPADACAILQACSGATKYVVMPAATEGGNRVQRGLFWNPGNEKQPMILERQIAGLDVYVFLMSPDGKLLKTAYAETGKAWVPMGMALSEPTFDKETKAWHAWVTKPGASAPKPAAAAAQ